MRIKERRKKKDKSKASHSIVAPLSLGTHPSQELLFPRFFLGGQALFLPRTERLVAGLPVQEEKVIKKKKDITREPELMPSSQTQALPVIQSLQEVGAQARTRAPSDGVTQHKALHKDRKAVSRDLGRDVRLVSLPRPNTLMSQAFLCVHSG